jgi:dynein heavy chain, axonemal
LQDKQLAWKKLAFSLAFFHAVIQERRKFGPNGWNIRYEFNQSDIECSMMTIQMFLEEKDQIPWDAMEFVVGQINYGGRVTDDNDRRCLMAILRKYILPDVLKESYKFTPSGLYYSPATPQTTLEQMHEYIDALPASDAPEVFGMHPNASIQSQLQETNLVLQTVVSMQPRIATSGSGESPEEAIYKLAEKILAEIPQVCILR